MMSASIFWSFIAARTAPQRRSSSSVEIGWLTRSLAAMNAPLALHHVDHPLHVPRQPLSHVLLDHGKSEARGSGSVAKTSSAAPAIFPLFSASTRASSSTTPPRARLTRYALGFIAAKVFAFTML